VRQLDETAPPFAGATFLCDALAPETFTATLNTALLSEQQIVDCVVPLVQAVSAVAALARCQQRLGWVEFTLQFQDHHRPPVRGKWPGHHTPVRTWRGPS